jgi:hypothetical protein
MNGSLGATQSLSLALLLPVPDFKEDSILILGVRALFNSQRISDCFCRCKDTGRSCTTMEPHHHKVRLVGSLLCLNACLLFMDLAIQRLYGSTAKIHYRYPIALQEWLGKSYHVVAQLTCITNVSTGQCNKPSYRNGPEFYGVSRGCKSNHGNTGGKLASVSLIALM